MKDNNEILKRVQLLMNYEMGKTLEENTKNYNHLINEQPGTIGRLFRIGGEELTGGLRTAMEDVSRIFREVGGIEIKSAEGSVVRAKNADELIDALHAGRMTENTITELYTGLLKSPKTPSAVIDTILSNKSFDAAFKSRYGSLMSDSEGLFNTLKQKGYPESTIEKMMKKVGVERTVTSAAAKGVLNSDELNAISSTFGKDVSTMSTEEVENLIRDFAKKRNIKIKESELKTIAEDGIKKIRQNTKNIEANAKDFENWWNNVATTADREKFLNSIISNPPKGVSSSEWGGFVKSLFKKVGTGVGKILLTIYSVGMGASLIVNGIAYFTGAYGETIWDVVKNTVWWPGGLKSALNRVNGVTSDVAGQGGSGQTDQYPQKDNRQKIDWY